MKSEAKKYVLAILHNFNEDGKLLSVKFYLNLSTGIILCSMWGKTYVTLTWCNKLIAISTLLDNQIMDKSKNVKGSNETKNIFFSLLIEKMSYIQIKMIETVFLMKTFRS